MTAKLTKISALCVFFINAVIITIPLMPSVGQCLNASFRISVVSVWKTTYIEREMVHEAKAESSCKERFQNLGWIDSLGAIMLLNRGTQREYSSQPLKHSIVKRILVFKRYRHRHIFIP